MVPASCGKEGDAADVAASTSGTATLGAAGIGTGLPRRVTTEGKTRRAISATADSSTAPSSASPSSASPSSASPSSATASRCVSSGFRRRDVLPSPSPGDVTVYFCGVPASSNGDAITDGNSFLGAGTKTLSRMDRSLPAAPLDTRVLSLCKSMPLAFTCTAFLISDLPSSPASVVAGACLSTDTVACSAELRVVDSGSWLAVGVSSARSPRHDSRTRQGMKVFRTIATPDRRKL